MIFPYLMSNWSYDEYFEKLQNSEIFRYVPNFFLQESLEIEYVVQNATQIPYILSFWLTLYL